MYNPSPMPSPAAHISSDEAPSLGHDCCACRGHTPAHRVSTHAAADGRPDYRASSAEEYVGEHCVTSGDVKAGAGDFVRIGGVHGSLPD